MEIKKIKLRDETPESLTVKLSVEELAQITWWLGNIPYNETPKGLEEFYSEATGTFFNRFWENGIRGCIDGDSE